MKDYQKDKFENFYKNLKTSREGLAEFGDFTATAAEADGVDPLIAGHAPALRTAVTGLRADMVKRKGQAGSSQTGTSAEQTAFDKFVVFVQATDKKVLGGYLYDNADEHDTYYPNKLSGLTQAPVKQRLTRLTAYTEALETSEDKTVKAQGAPARDLLKKYIKASSTKIKTRTSLLETIKDLGPAAEAVVECLWDISTAAVYVHRREPLQARRYFNFASLPGRPSGPKKTTTTKTT